MPAFLIQTALLVLLAYLCGLAVGKFLILVFGEAEALPPEELRAQGVPAAPGGAGSRFASRLRAAATARSPAEQARRAVREARRARQRSAAADAAPPRAEPQRAPGAGTIAASGGTAQRGAEELLQVFSETAGGRETASQASEVRPADAPQSAGAARPSADPVADPVGGAVEGSSADAARDLTAEGSVEASPPAGQSPDELSDEEHAPDEQPAESVESVGVPAGDGPTGPIDVPPAELSADPVEVAVAEPVEAPEPAAAPANEPVDESPAEPVGETAAESVEPPAKDEEPAAEPAGAPADRHQRRAGRGRTGLAVRLPRVAALGRGGEPDAERSGPPADETPPDTEMPSAPSHEDAGGPPDVPSDGSKVAAAEPGPGLEAESDPLSESGLAEQAAVEPVAPVPDEPGFDDDQPIGLEAPRGIADNLKRIRGVGAQNENKLNLIGIWHYNQIAEWTEGEAEWVSEYLGFPGRVIREDWVGQAAILAAGVETQYSLKVDRREAGGGSGEPR